MPDISMCAASACPRSKECYRHADSGTKPSEHWQTYSAFAHGVDGCASFWLVDENGGRRAREPRP